MKKAKICQIYGMQICHAFSVQTVKKSQHLLIFVKVLTNIYPRIYFANVCVILKNAPNSQVMFAKM